MPIGRTDLGFPVARWHRDRRWHRWRTPQSRVRHGGTCCPRPHVVAHHLGRLGDGVTRLPQGIRCTGFGTTRLVDSPVPVVVTRLVVGVGPLTPVGAMEGVVEDLHRVRTVHVVRTAGGVDLDGMPGVGRGAVPIEPRVLDGVPRRVRVGHGALAVAVEGPTVDGEPTSLPISRRVALRVVPEPPGVVRGSRRRRLGVAVERRPGRRDVQVGGDVHVRVQVERPGEDQFLPCRRCRIHPGLDVVTVPTVHDHAAGGAAATTLWTLLE